jgi:hypothetical protein
MAKRKVRFRVPQRSLVTQSALIGDPRRGKRGNTGSNPTTSVSAAFGVATSTTPVTGSSLRRLMRYAGTKGRSLSPRDAARALRAIRALMNSGYSFRGALKALYGDPLIEALHPPASVYADFSPLTIQRSNSYTLEAPFGPAVYASHNSGPKFSGAIRSIISTHPAAPVRRLLTLIPNA